MPHFFLGTTFTHTILYDWIEDIWWVGDPLPSCNCIGREMLQPRAFTKLVVREENLVHRREAVELDMGLYEVHRLVITSNINRSFHRVKICVCLSSPGSYRLTHTLTYNTCLLLCVLFYSVSRRSHTAWSKTTEPWDRFAEASAATWPQSGPFVPDCWGQGMRYLSYVFQV